MKESCIEFYVNKFCLISSLDKADTNFIPPLIKRRLSKLDKCALSSIESCVDNFTENIVFSSKTGELERLTKIISQYTEGEDVSPATFSGSVHNYPAGVFLLINKKSIPYTALSASNYSISSGILTSLVTKYNHTVFCYADNNKDDYISFSLNLTKTPSKNSVKYSFTPVNNDLDKDNFIDYSEFFKGEKDIIYTKYGIIKRLEKC